MLISERLGNAFHRLTSLLKLNNLYHYFTVFND
jgi:hypothetical protein